MAKVRKIENGYSIEASHRELVVMISALGWADSLITSDEAFVDYVGCPRPEFLALLDSLADSYKAIK
jgi:hypothetical protein